VVSEESAFQPHYTPSDRNYDRAVPTNVLFTIGHSTHSIEEFIALLNAHRIRHLVDVRSIPKSRHVPQFNTDDLSSSLSAANIAYTHLKALGGRRHSRKDSTNTGWRNPSFRGYADYMATPQFAEGLAALAQIASTTPTAIMCAEAVPWRCHRSLTSDAMILKAWEVRDILTTAPAKEHKLTPFLKIVDGQPTYPASDESATLFDPPKKKYHLERSQSAVKRQWKDLPRRLNYRHRTRVPHPSSAWVGKHDPNNRQSFFRSRSVTDARVRAPRKAEVSQSCRRSPRKGKLNKCLSGLVKSLS